MADSGMGNSRIDDSVISSSGAKPLARRVYVPPPTNAHRDPLAETLPMPKSASAPVEPGSPTDALIARYERIVERLQSTVVDQTREMELLRHALSEQQSSQQQKQPSLSTYSPPRPMAVAAVPSEQPLPYTAATQLPRHWREVVEEHVFDLLHDHMRRMDERIALSIADRLRRVTKQHIEASVKREVARYLRNAALDPAHDLHGWVRDREAHGARVMPSLRKTGAGAATATAAATTTAATSSKLQTSIERAMPHHHSRRANSSALSEMISADDALVQLEIEKLRRHVAEVERRQDAILAQHETRRRQEKSHHAPPPQQQQMQTRGAAVVIHSQQSQQPMSPIAATGQLRGEVSRSASTSSSLSSSGGKTGNTGAVADGGSVAACACEPDGLRGRRSSSSSSRSCNNSIEAEDNEVQELLRRLQRRHL